MTKRLSPEEQALWDAFVKNIRPIKNDKAKPSSSFTVKVSEKIYLPTPEINRTQKVGVLHPNDLRSIRLDGQLDLHGFTQVAGELALREFLKNALYRGWRWVRIITGKGSPNRPSVLREQMPKWLQVMPEFVTGFAYAKPDDGGSGAFYVKIRRKVKA